MDLVWQEYSPCHYAPKVQAERYRRDIYAQYLHSDPQNSSIHTSNQSNISKSTRTLGCACYSLFVSSHVIEQAMPYETVFSGSSEYTNKTHTDTTLRHPPTSHRPQTYVLGSLASYAFRNLFCCRTPPTATYGVHGVTPDPVSQSVITHLVI
jgi:hypothetical protein